MFHLGAAAAWRKPDAANAQDQQEKGRLPQWPRKHHAIVKLDSRAETHVSRAKFLSTGDMVQ